ncbi:MAG: hypothetical protein Q9183_006971, partial [Haloplaca sp. 2 TL-2023]
DRSSRFIALYSPHLSAKELQAKAEFKTATHRIAAWRHPSSQRSLNSQPLFETGHDDDGEKYGGKNLANVLKDMNVEGAVVVARWYGGVMLGPVRFEHIRSCAREAILKCVSPSDGPQNNKKVKVEDSGERREELIRVLPERDQSIVVLRGLLAEKQHSSSSEKASPAKVPEYATLPLKTLENLDRARDATIGWILKQIEKAEAEAKSALGEEDKASDSQQNSRQITPPTSSKPGIVLETTSSRQPPVD